MQSVSIEQYPLQMQGDGVIYAHLAPDHLMDNLRVLEESALLELVPADRHRDKDTTGRNGGA
ncbi:hypothetical protein J2046_001360 [Rhizobium petrolearium]|nr:hypothetical protein [Neorhizobium petrolearium]